MTRVQPCHPHLLILDDPLQCGDGVLLLPDLALEFLQMVEDETHIDTHFVDILAVTIDMSRDVFDFLFVIIEGLLLGNDIGPEVRFQSITLKG